MPSRQEVTHSTTKLAKNLVPDGAVTDLSSNKIAKQNLKSSHQINGSPGLNPDSAAASEKPFATSLPNVAITLERQLYIPQPGDKLVDPGTARVNLAASKESPDGTPKWRDEHAHQTVLQQHCSYWDQDGDGVIYPWHIYLGCRAWGWNPLLSMIVVLVIAPTMSYPTLPKGKWLPDPMLRIYLNNIHKDKHGSDSNTYDSEGRFRPQQFEDFFAKYDLNNKGGLDKYDLARAHRGQRMVADPFGWTASVLEWLALYLLLWPEDGVMKKDEVRMSFDGSIFQYKADEYAKKRKGKKA